MTTRLRSGAACFIGVWADLGAPPTGGGSCAPAPPASDETKNKTQSYDSFAADAVSDDGAATPDNAD